MENIGSVESQAAVSNDEQKSVDIATLKQNVTAVDVPPCENGTSPTDNTPGTDSDITLKTDSNTSPGAAGLSNGLIFMLSK